MIAVRPPEYWPRPEFFALMDEADEFVLADTFQYSRQSFQNRSPLRTPDGRQWISIPLKGGQHGLPILEVRIGGKHRWIGKHWRALQFNYRTTPFFEFYEHRLRPVFDRDWNRLSDLTAASVEIVRDLLGIDTPVALASQLSGAPSTLDGILEVTGREDLLIPRESLRVDAVLAASVLEFDAPRYRQNFEGFEPEMSVLDLLFNYGPACLTMIRSHTRLVETSSQ